MNFHIRCSIQAGIVSPIVLGTDDHILPCTVPQNDRIECFRSSEDRGPSVGGDNSVQMVVSCGQLGDEGVSDLCKEGADLLFYFFH